jgi:dUTP pyrophosphatase
MPVYATRDVTIEKGSRIAQFRIMENQPKIQFEETVLENKNRGGFGSTGTF